MNGFTGFRNKAHGRYGKRHKPGEMNATESAYADMLEARKRSGDIIDWHFEAITYKIADNTTYKPDFYVVLPDAIELVDVKGAGPIDAKAIVKIKVAAARYFAYRWVIEQKQTKKNGGGWRRTEY